MMQDQYSRPRSCGTSTCVCHCVAPLTRYQRHGRRVFVSVNAGYSPHSLNDTLTLLQQIRGGQGLSRFSLERDSRAQGRRISPDLLPE